jgi:hypothetical protein
MIHQESRDKTIIATTADGSPTGSKRMDLTTAVTLTEVVALTRAHTAAVTLTEVVALTRAHTAVVALTVVVTLMAVLTVVVALTAALTAVVGAATALKALRTTAAFYTLDPCCVAVAPAGDGHRSVRTGVTKASSSVPLHLGGGFRTGIARWRRERAPVGCTRGAASCSVPLHLRRRVSTTIGCTPGGASFSVLLHLGGGFRIGVPLVDATIISAIDRRWTGNTPTAVT